MCNLYSVTTNQEAIRPLFRVDTDLTGNMPPLPGVYPDYAAPVVHVREGERVLSMYRWGMPSSKKVLFDATAKRADKLRAKGKPVDFEALLRMVPDGDTTNVRNTASSHWKRWLGPESRCLVPMTSFSEFNRDAGGNVWFAVDETRPLVCFVGIKVEGWTSVRKAKEGEVTASLYAFLTTDPNREVGAVHPKAMPVILTTPEEADTWLGHPGRRRARCNGRYRTTHCGSWRAANGRTRRRRFDGPARPVIGEVEICRKKSPDPLEEVLGHYKSPTVEADRLDGRRRRRGVLRTHVARRRMWL